MKKKDYWAKRFFIKGFENFKLARWYFLVAACLFLVSCIVSFVLPEKFVFFDIFLKGIVDKIDGMNGYEIAWFIFSNNVTAAFSALVSGVVFGVIPIFNIIFNGLILGYVVGLAHGAEASFADIFLNLAPHGVFELPAIFFAVGLGMRIGFGFFKDYFIFYKKNKGMKFLGLSILAFAFLVSCFCLIMVFSSYSNSIQEINYRSSFIIFSEIIVLAPMAFLFLFSNFKLLAFQKKGFVRRFVGGIKAFFVIILPLLIVAAIIESILILFA